MPTAFSSVVQPKALSVLYLGNALWRTSAFIHFGFRQEHMMRKLARRRSSNDPVISSRPQGDLWHHDIMAYLGGLNSSLAFLALLSIWAPSRFCPSHSGNGEITLDIATLSVLGLANFSQAAVNMLKGRLTGRWIMCQGWDRVTVFDVLLTTLDWSATLLKIWGL